ncbi:MAG: CTP synthetase [Alphaproteobacteria bacterium HGW-Alphaproteobacteria-4]|jgi:preprotein translocase subunit SecF|nr:MAG: CTP synthetase [Alphaproteobacteria bacterium HGW-Alphaproteobacteria-4]
MFRLASILYALAGPTLAGILVIAALTTGRDDLRSILWAAVIGAVLGLPTAWIIAKKILSA